MDTETYDVAVLGADLSGTLLASILGRQGFRVLLLEKGSLPRFAVGEAMLPPSSKLLWILGQRFDVPEIRHLSSCRSIREQVSPTCGVQRSIGFLYHQEGRRQDPAKSHLLVPPATPLCAESHLFRQEVDLYMLQAAIAHGAVYREGVDVRDLAAGPDGVLLRPAGGEEFRARYLVDVSGRESIAAARLGLREEEPPLLTRSRSIFTHMIGVERYDDLLEPGDDPGLSAQWYEGTLHHVFAGGWLWIVPFNNHDRSENPLCSVGLTLDMTRFPARGLAPEEEFAEIVARFPTIAAHLRGAEAVRPWVGTGRLQYSARGCQGDRVFLLGDSYGAVDPLYSRGLQSTLETLNALAPRLLAALRDDDFARDRFAYPERLQAALLTATDRRVHDSYRAMACFPLWNAWLRLWVAATMFEDLRLFRACMRYLASSDPAHFARLDEGTPRGEDLGEDLLALGGELLDGVDAGEATADKAADRILAALAASPLPPVHRWGDPRARHLDFTPEKLGSLLRWGRTEAPREIRRLFDFDPTVLGGLHEAEETRALVGALA
ncbi:MAG TPA: hypothetical protein VOA87_09940 [Thermoanaerobaculia bacterium]|nr:hypothetical protein [Thermoanaerobaculia bacterium]